MLMRSISIYEIIDWIFNIYKSYIFNNILCYHRGIKMFSWVQLILYLLNLPPHVLNKITKQINIDKLIFRITKLQNLFNFLLRNPKSIQNLFQILNIYFRFVLGNRFHSLLQPPNTILDIPLILYTQLS